MTADLDEHQLFADHRADELRDRDRRREPRLHRHPRCIVPARPVAHAFTDEPTIVGEGPRLVDLECPACMDRVTVPSDSDRERVNCYWCKAPLITRATPGGVELDRVRLQRGAP